MSDIVLQKIRPIEGADGIIVWTEDNGIHVANVYVRKKKEHAHELESFILVGRAYSFTELDRLEEKAKESNPIK